MALACFGCLMVYSASFYSAEYHYGNRYFFLLKQIMGVVLGVVMMAVLSHVDYHIYKKYRLWIVAGAVVLLAAVFVPGLGIESYGAKRWISILGFSIQPSEIAKFALVIFIAGYMSENHNKVKTFKGLLPVLGVGGIICLLTMLEPSMSVTMCLAFVTLFMLIIGGISKKHTLMFSLPAAAVVPLLVVLEPYRLRRLMAFIDPWASPQGEGFQLIQSLYSLGSGGFFWSGAVLFQTKVSFFALCRVRLYFVHHWRRDWLCGCVRPYVCFLSSYSQLNQNCAWCKRPLWRNACQRCGFHNRGANAFEYSGGHRFNSANRASAALYFKWRHFGECVYGGHWHMFECA